MNRTSALIASVCLAIVACGDSAATRAAQLDKCTIIGRQTNPQPSGDAVTRCLILQYDWDGRAALAAGAAYQARLDSISVQLAAVEARDEARRDSIAWQLAAARARSAALAERRRVVLDSLARECWSLSYRLDADSSLSPLDRGERLSACRDSIPLVARKLGVRQ